VLGREEAEMRNVDYQILHDTAGATLIADWYEDGSGYLPHEMGMQGSLWRGKDGKPFVLTAQCTFYSADPQMIREIIGQHQFLDEYIVGLRIHDEAMMEKLADGESIEADEAANPCDGDVA
jgi:hypothetical protein